MKKKVLANNRLVEIKDYARTFNRCRQTASKMLKADREDFGFPRITISRFLEMYGRYPKGFRPILEEIELPS